MKNILLVGIYLLSTIFSTLWAQEVPQGVTYQAIARDAQGQPLMNQSISLQIEVLNGGPNGTVVYLEQHNNKKTNKFGLFTLEIGQGNSGDDFREIAWQSGNFHVKTSIDIGSGFDLVGTFPILSVPYSLLAQKAIEDAVDDADADAENELQELSFNVATQELSISNGNTISIPMGGIDADADPDPQNEIQILSLSGTTIELSNGGGSINLPTGTTDTDNQNLSLNGTDLTIDDGNTVDLSVLQDGVNDADSDPQNELQELSFDPTTQELSLSDGNSITIPTGGTDADADPQNELQELSFDPNTQELSLSDGNSIIIPTGGTDADADPQNELQTLSLTGTTISLSGGGGSIDLPTGTTDTDDQNLSLTGTNLTIDDGNTVDLSALQDGVNDADSDPQNELQTIDITGNTVTLSNGGGAFDLPTGTTNTDDQNLTLNGTNLTIDDGNTVDLSALQDGVNDADSDPQNELQTIDITGNTVTLSNGGGTFDLPTGTTNTDDQNLTLNGTNLTIDDGNTVDLSALRDGVNDADADPQNELQGLTLNGNTLTLSNGGGSVQLTTANSLWEQGNGFIFHDAGDARILNNAGNPLVSLGDDGRAGGAIELFRNNQLYAEMYALSEGVNGAIGQLYLYGSNGRVNVDLSATSNGNDGYLGLRDENGEEKVHLTSSSDAGRILLFGQNGNLNAGNLIFANNPNNGAFGVFKGIPTTQNGSLIPEAQMFVDANDNGVFQITGTAGFTTVTAGMYVDNFGSVVEAGLKNFVMQHPKEADKEIVYACIEGPEAAAYERGTGKLENGEAFIPFSEHFELVINPKTLTVNLTPLSANTMGLAVVEKTVKGIRVKELMNGSGNFEFDWEVKAVRKGYEEYKVVRAKREHPKMILPEINKGSKTEKDGM